MKLIKEIREKAQQLNKHIVLPEATEPRMLKALEIIRREKIARITLLGNPDEIRQIAKNENVDLLDVPIIEPIKSEYFEEYCEFYCERRKKKGITLEKAQNIMKDTLFYGATMVAKNVLDGFLAGAVNSTGNVLRAAIHCVGLAEGINVVSSTFLMILPEFAGKKEMVFSFAGCSVVPDPTPEQLASTAYSSAITRRQLIGDEPIVAFLSFSTYGSAKHILVEKVTNAVEILKDKKPDFVFDGELQLDAAIIPSIAKRKAPDSLVAGKANVLVFPDLNAGNIGYKLVQRLANAEAVGPVIQGLAKPCNDLSRGCSVDDIVNMVAITALEAA